MLGIASTDARDLGNEPAEIMSLQQFSRKVFTKTLIYHCLLWYRARRQRRELASLKTFSIESVTLSLEGLSQNVRNAVTSGSYEFSERTLCRKHLTASDSIVEIGSALGFIGLFCRQNIGIENQVSVEADPRTAELLRRNYALNNVAENLMVRALAARSGPIDFYQAEDLWGNSLTSTEAQGSKTKITVEGITSGELFGGLKSPPTALVVDIEGGELELHPETIPSTVRTIIIELHPWIYGFPTEFEYIRRLQNNGFKVAEVMESCFALHRR